ncbi:recombinase family protein [Streptomyces griseofuscus]|uniref:recombinase family protein n=1 Tax=Streptomyces griseofuscus TaxID=146922 RepID=UPI000F6535AC|nr:recombinase family protein [Streptomyces griseofuscus]
MRLSKYTDASTSPEVQTEFIYEGSRAIGGEVVGWANDTDISALKTTPWEREQLRHWLDRPAEWDALIWQRMDRAVRSMADMADLGRYAKKHGKRLIFASGPGGGRLELDFSSPMSELIMLILAFAAQLEGQTIMERNRGAAAHLQALGRWAGGIIPYGTIPVRKTFSDGNEGWWLGRDVDLTWNYVTEMVDKALAGRGYSYIRDHLNEQRIITPKNHRARLATPPRKHDPESRWSDTTVRDILRSQVLRGYQTREDGSVVRDAEGNPVRAGEALVEDDVWFALQSKLDELSQTKSQATKRKDGHPLLGVLKCDECGANAYHFANVSSQKMRRYGTAFVTQIRSSALSFVTDDDAETMVIRVPGNADALADQVFKDAKLRDRVVVAYGADALALPVGKMSYAVLVALWDALQLGPGLEHVQKPRKRHLFHCQGKVHAPGVKSPSIDFNDTLRWVDEEFMRRLGRLRRTEVITTGGVDNRAAIKELESDIAALVEQLAKLRGAAADMVGRQLNGLSDKLEELSKVPFIPPQRQTVRLDRTWGDDWVAASRETRLDMLRSAGVEVFMRCATHRGQPVGERLRMEIGKHVTPEQDALDDVVYQESF